MKQSKKWIAIIHFETADEYPPYTWDWPALLGETVDNVHIYNATDADDLPNRIRLTEEGVEEV